MCKTTRNVLQALWKMCDNYSDEYWGVGRLDDFPLITLEDLDTALVINECWRDRIVSDTGEVIGIMLYRRKNPLSLLEIPTNCCWICMRRLAILERKTAPFLQTHRLMDQNLLFLVASFFLPSKVKPWRCFEP